MKYLLIFLLSVGVYADTTTGDYSPIIKQVGGDVHITGVPQRVVNRLLDDLDKMDLTIEEKNKELEESAKKYRSLEQEVERFKLANVDDTAIQGFVELALVALRKGDFAEAERLAGELLDKHLENKVTQAASANFIKGQALSLQYKPVEALPYLKKAYNYRSENREYAFAYALLLQKQQQFKQAIPIYEDILQIDRESGDKFELATTLNNLAILYENTNYYELAEKYFLEALDILRKLAKANPKAYEPDVVLTLNNLANLYNKTNRYDLAEKYYLEALEFYRKFAEVNPMAYELDVADTLGKLGLFYSEQDNQEKSQKYYNESISIYRHWYKKHPKLYATKLFVALVLTAISAKENPCPLFKEALSLAPSEEWRQTILNMGKQCQLQD